MTRTTETTADNAMHSGLGAPRTAAFQRETAASSHGPMRGFPTEHEGAYDDGPDTPTFTYAQCGEHCDVDAVSKLQRALGVCGEDCGREEIAARDRQVGTLHRQAFAMRAMLADAGLGPKAAPAVEYTRVNRKEAA
jgi:hypothetical protein